MTDELLVQFHEEAGDALRLRVIEELGCVLKEEIIPQKIFVVRCPQGASLKKFMEQFRSRSEVAHVEPNEETNLLDENGGGCHAT